MNSMITSGSFDKYLEQKGAFSDADPKELARAIEKHWRQYEWEAGDLIDEDKDEREEYWVMTCEVDDFTFEGTGVYSCGELILIENIEQKLK